MGGAAGGCDIMASREMTRHHACPHSKAAKGSHQPSSQQSVCAGPAAEISKCTLAVQCAQKAGHLRGGHRCSQHSSLPPPRLPLCQRMGRVVPVHGVGPAGEARGSRRRQQSHIYIPKLSFLWWRSAHRSRPACSCAPSKGPRAGHLAGSLCSQKPHNAFPRLHTRQRGRHEVRGGAERATLLLCGGQLLLLAGETRLSRAWGSRLWPLLYAAFAAAPPLYPTPCRRATKPSAPIASRRLAVPAADAGRRNRPAS
jgi:hypothetical protein